VPKVSRKDKKRIGAQQTKQETVNEVVSLNAGVVTEQSQETILGNNSLNNLLSDKDMISSF
jgi:hypothetical protein